MLLRDRFFMLLCNVVKPYIDKGGLKKKLLKFTDCAAPLLAQLLP